MSGNYPERLYKALMNSSTVLTVWDGGRLVGLTRVLDDTEMLAQIHYVLVDLEYQGQGIAGRMIEYIKDKYKDFLYIEGMPEDRENCRFIRNMVLRRWNVGRRFRSAIIMGKSKEMGYCVCGILFGVRKRI